MTARARGAAGPTRADARVPKNEAGLVTPQTSAYAELPPMRVPEGSGGARLPHLGDSLTAFRAGRSRRATPSQPPMRCARDDPHRGPIAAFIRCTMPIVGPRWGRVGNSMGNTHYVTVLAAARPGDTPWQGGGWMAKGTGGGRRCGVRRPDPERSAVVPARRAAAVARRWRTARAPWTGAEEGWGAGGGGHAGSWVSPRRTWRCEAVWGGGPKIRPNWGGSTGPRGKRADRHSRRVTHILRNVSLHSNSS